MSEVVGKLLPNLQVTLDDDELIVEDFDEEFLENAEMQVNYLKQDVKINSSWMQNFQKPKIYRNTSGGFTTGLDLMSEDNTKVLEKRAERFGFANGTVKMESIASLYESMDVPIDNKNSAKFKNFRLDTIHMRGVEEMSTRDVFIYFKDYGPGGVEWINDYSCNVLWLDESTAARALLRLSKPLAVKQANAENDDHQSSSLTLTDSRMPVADHDSSKEEGMITDDEDDDKTATDKLNSQAKETCSESPQSLDIPVPPGRWRLGVQHPKAKTILLRFATMDDKKKPGSEKRSNYYKKYGNPNYGGMKGLISSSCKRKIQAEQNRHAVKLESGECSSDGSDDHAVMPPKREKVFRMRMYADDEELANATRVRRSYERQESVHSRLGTKFTQDDLFQLGHHVSPLNREYSSSAYKSMDSFKKRNFYRENEPDLRRKIKRLKDDSSSKHRSPLWRDK